jgi:hypothetical protein
MSTFDPDSFLAGSSSSEFDPNAFLGNAPSGGFDPDAFLQSPVASTKDAGRDAFGMGAGTFSNPTAVPEKEFFRIDDTISGIWDAVRGLGVTAPAAFYQLVEGLERPDQYSESAKKAFAEADAYLKEMQEKTEANLLAGKSSSVGESFREAGGSLGFSLGSMAAAIPASIGGAKAGAAAGATIAAAAGFAGPQALAPEEIATVPVGAGLGGLIGGAVSAMAASGTAAYRMAGAQFMNEMFNAGLEEYELTNKAPMPEEERKQLFNALLPVAKNSALWEAGPEAVGNAFMLGAGKIILGGTAKKIATELGKDGIEMTAKRVAAIQAGKLASPAERLLVDAAAKKVGSKFLNTKLGKLTAAAASVPPELVTEAMTQVEQSADQKKGMAIATGEDPNQFQADWSVGGVVDAFKEVAPQTLALMALMGGGAGAVKGSYVGIQKLRDRKLDNTADALGHTGAAPLEASDFSEVLPEVQDSATIDPNTIVDPLPQVAAVMGGINTPPAPEAQGVELALPTSQKGVAAKVLHAKDDIKSALTSIFGAPAAEKDWLPDMKTSDIKLAENPMNKEQDVVYVKQLMGSKEIWRPTKRVYNRAEGAFAEMDQTTEDHFKSKNLTPMDQSVSLQTKFVAQKPAQDAQQEVLDDVDAQQAPLPATPTAKPPSQGDVALNSLREGLASGKLTMDDIRAKAAWVQPKVDQGKMPSSDNEQKTYEQIAATKLLAEQPATAAPIMQSAPVAKPVTELEEVVTNPPAAKNSVTPTPSTKPTPLQSGALINEADNESISSEKTESIISRTSPGPEREAAIAKRREAAVSLAKTIKAGDSITTATGEVLVAKQDANQKNGEVLFEGNNEPVQAADYLSPDRVSVDGVRMEFDAGKIDRAKTLSTKGEQSSTQGEQNETENQAINEIEANDQEQAEGQVLTIEGTAMAAFADVETDPATKALIADGLATVASGESESIDSLRDVVKTPEGASAVKAALEAAEARAASLPDKQAKAMRQAVQMTRDTLGKHVGKGLTLGTSTSPTTTKMTDVQPESPGRVHITTESWTEAVKPKDPKKPYAAAVTLTNRPLRIGGLLTVGSKDGTGVDAVYFVAGQSVDGKGNVSHQLSRIDIENKVTKATMAAEKMNQFRIESPSTPKMRDIIKRLGGLKPENRNQTLIRVEMEQLIRASLERIIGKSASDASLRFDLTEGAMQVEMIDGKPVVRVNPAFYSNTLLQRMDGVDYGNTIGTAGIAEGLVNEIEQTLYEETSHTFVVNEYESTPAGRSKAQVAAADLRALAIPEAGGRFFDAIRWTLGGRGDTLTNEELLAEFDSKDETFHRYVVYELMAMLQAVTSSGSTVADTRVAAQKWAQEAAGPNAKRSVIDRLIALANEYFQAIHRFLKGQREINSLPPSARRMFDNLDALMKEGGVRAPNPIGVAEAAVDDLNSELSLMRRMAKNQSAYTTSQKALREELKKIKLVTPSAKPVTLSPDGRLELDPLFEKKHGEVINPILDELNSNMRPEMAVRFAVAAQDLHLVLSRLNEGNVLSVSRRQFRDKDSKLQTIWENATDLRGIRRAAAIRILDASGLTRDKLAQSLQNAARSIVGAPLSLDQYHAGNEQLLEYLSSAVGFGDVVTEYRKAKAAMQKYPGFFEGIDFTAVEQAAERAQLAQELGDQVAFRKEQALISKELQAALSGKREESDQSAFTSFRFDREASESEAKKYVAAKKRYLDASRILAERMESASQQKDKEGKPTVMATEIKRVRQEQARIAGSVFNDLVDKRDALGSIAQRPLQTEAGAPDSRSADQLIEEFINQHASYPALVERVLTDALGNMEATKALRDASKFSAAAERVANFEKEFEYLVVGGRPPVSMSAVRGKFGAVWQPVNISSEELPNTISLSSPRTPRVLLGIGESFGVARDAVMDPQKPSSASFTMPSEYGVVDVVWEESDAAQRQLEADGFKVGDRIMFRDPSSFIPVVSAMANELADGSAAASQLFGFQPLTYLTDPVTGESILSSDANEFAVSNARLMTNIAIRSLHEGRWFNHNVVSHEAYLTKGFAVPLMEDEDSENHFRRHKFRDKAIDMSAFNELLNMEGTGIEKALNMIQKGAMARLLVDSLRFMHEQSNTESTTTTTPLLSHDGGLTPAGLALQALAPKAAELLSLTKGLTMDFTENWNTPEQKTTTVQIQEALITSLANKEDQAFLRQAFQNLAHDTIDGVYYGVESTSVMKRKREALQARPTTINSYLWDLQRAAKVVNAIYDSAHRLGTVLETSEELTPEKGYPLNLDALDNSRFRINRVQHASKPGFNNEHVFVSPLLPKPTTEFLDSYQRLLNRPEARQLYGIDQALAARIGASASTLRQNENLKSSLLLGVETGGVLADPSKGRDDPNGMREGDVMATGAGTFDQQSMMDMDKYSEEKWIKAMAMWRGQTLLAIFGGSEDAMLTLINSPEFSSVVGDRIEYHHEKIDSWILDQLAKFHEEEKRIGVIREVGTLNSTADDSVRALAERVSARERTVLELVLETTGSLETASQEPIRFSDAMFPSTVADLERGEKEGKEFFTADARTLLQTFTRMIPKISVLSGKASYRLAEDYGSIQNKQQAELNFDQIPFDAGMTEVSSGGRRIPAIMFIADPQAPTIVRPYGDSVEATREELQDAITGMLEWLADYGQINLTEAIEPIIIQFGKSVENRTSLIESIRQRYVESMRWAEREWGPLEDARVDALAKKWTGIIDAGVSKALLESDSKHILAFENLLRQRESSLTNKDAAAMLSGFLFDPQMKKALVLAMRADPKLPNPSPANVAARGDLVPIAHLPGFDSEILMDQVFQTYRKSEMINRKLADIEEMSNEDILAEGEEDAQAAFEDLANAEEGEDIFAKLSEQGLSPLRDIQGEWAAKVLHAVLDRLEIETESYAAMVAREGDYLAPINNPFATKKEIDAYKASIPKLRPTGLVATPRPEGVPPISKFEARQMLAALDPEELNFAIRGSRSGTVSGFDQGGITIDQIMSVTDAMAENLRNSYRAFKTVERNNVVSEDIARSNSAWSFASPFTYTYNNDMVWHEGRVKKGIMDALEKLHKSGSKLVAVVPTKAGGVSYRLLADLSQLRQEAAAAGLLKRMSDPRDESAPRLDELQLAQRDFEEAIAKHEEWKAALRKDAVADSNRAAAYESMLKELDDISKELLGAANFESMKNILHKSGKFDLEGGSTYDVSPVIKMAFDDADALHNSLAEQLVSDFDELSSAALNRFWQGGLVTSEQEERSIWARGRERALDPIDQPIAQALSEAGIDGTAFDTTSRRRSSFMLEFMEIAEEEVLFVGDRLDLLEGLPLQIMELEDSIDAMVADGVDRDSRDFLVAESKLRAAVREHENIPRDLEKSVARLVRRSNFKVANMIDPKMFALDSDLSNVSEIAARYKAILNRMQKPFELVKMSYNAMARSVMKNASSFGVGDIASDDFSGVSQQPTMSLPEASILPIRAILAETKTSRASKKRQIIKVLEQHSGNNAAAANAAASQLREVLGERLTKSQRTKGATIVELFAVADRLEAFKGIDSITKNAITSKVLNELLQEAKGASEAEVRRKLTIEAREARRYSRRRETAHATRGGNISSHLELLGKADDKAIVMAWLMKYGNRWSHNYMALGKDQSIVDGFSQSVDRAKRADELMSLGADLMTMVTGKEHLVVGDFIAEAKLGVDPVLLTKAMEMRQQQLETAALDMGYKSLADMGQKNGDTRSPRIGSKTSVALMTHPGSTARTDMQDRVGKVMKRMGAMGHFGTIDERSKALSLRDQLGVLGLDPHKSVHDDVRDRLTIMAKAYDSGKLVGQRPEPDPANPTASIIPLHTRISMLFNELETSGAADSIRSLHAVSNDVIGFLAATNKLQSIIDGFIPGAVFKKSTLRYLLNHDPMVRAVFAKDLHGQEAVGDIIGLLDHGPTGGTGRNGYTRDKNAYEKILEDARKMLKGSDALLDGSMAYTYEAIRASLFESAGDPVKRAEGILRGFDQADEGFATAMAAMPELMDDASLKSFLKMPFRAMQKAAEVLTSPAQKMLEQIRLYEHVRDNFKPYLQGVANGSINTKTEDSITDFNDAVKISESARAYGRRVRDIMENLKSAYVMQAQFAGHDVSKMKESPAVGFHWRTFGFESNPSSDPRTFIDSLSMDRASWLVGASRNPKRGEVHLMNVNGFEAVEHHMRDMLYRMHVQPAYASFRAAVGESQMVNGNKLSAVQAGWMEAAAKKLGSKEQQDDGISASRFIALLGQEILGKDASVALEPNMIMDMIQKGSQLGAVSALTSLSQVYRQTLPAITFYSLTYGKGGENHGYPLLFMRYAYARVLNKFDRREGMASDNFARNIDHMINNYGINSYIRSADGQQIYFENVKRMKLKREQRAAGRLSGRARPLVDVALYVPREVGYWSMRLADLMLKSVLAKPESFVVRSIWANEMTKALNKKRAITGAAPLSVEEAMDPNNDHHQSFDEAMLSQAEKAVTDLLAASDPGKKSRLFHQADTLSGELIRGSFAMFANHLMHIGGNSYGAYQMIKHGNEETQKAGWRLLSTNVGQNMMFQVLKYNMIAWGLANLYTLLTGGDDEDEERIHGAFYGITPDGGEEERRKSFMHWAATLAGGTAPIGWNPNIGAWEDGRVERDMKMLGLRGAQEIVQQTPFAGIGLFASTAIGSSLTQYVLKNTVMELLPGEMPHYERAGFVWPESLGGEGLGPQSESAIERMAYNTSKVFMNDIAGRSTLTGGIETLIDPMVQMSNARNETGALEKMLLLMSAFPPMPREFRREFQRPFQQEADADIWDGSWGR